MVYEAFANHLIHNRRHTARRRVLGSGRISTDFYPTLLDVAGLDISRSRLSRRSQPQATAERRESLDRQSCSGTTRTTQAKAASPAVAGATTNSSDASKRRPIPLFNLSKT